MMRRNRRSPLGKGLGALFILAAAAGPVLAADHTDGTPANLNQPDASSDITDVFAWTADASHVNLVMDVFPNAMAGSKFSNVVKYVFHTQAKASLLAATATTASIVCTFATDQTISCWALDASNNVLDYVTGSASATAGLSSTSGKLKVFAGLRDDAFFFNLAGFKHTTQTVAGAIKAGPGAGNAIISIDTNGCPTLSAAAQALVVTQLKSNAAGTGPGLDFFAKGTAGSPDQPLSGNVLSIVVQADRSLLAASTSAPVIGVWASTNK